MKILLTLHFVFYMLCVCLPTVGMPPSLLYPPKRGLLVLWIPQQCPIFHYLYLWLIRWLPYQSAPWSTESTLTGSWWPILLLTTLPGAHSRLKRREEREERREKRMIEMVREERGEREEKDWVRWQQHSQELILSLNNTPRSKREERAEGNVNNK